MWPGGSASCSLPLPLATWRMAAPCWHWRSWPDCPQLWTVRGSKTVMLLAQQLKMRSVTYPSSLSPFSSLSHSHFCMSFRFYLLFVFCLEGRQQRVSDVSPPVCNLRAVIRFYFTISFLLLLSPFALSVLSIFFFFWWWPILPTFFFPENSSANFCEEIVFLCVVLG